MSSHDPVAALHGQIAATVQALTDAGGPADQVGRRAADAVLALFASVAVEHVRVLPKEDFEDQPTMFVPRHGLVRVTHQRVVLHTAVVPLNPESGNT